MSTNRLQAVSSNPVMKEFAQGAATQSASPIAEFLAPTVNVARPTGKIKIYSSKNRFRIPDTRRALGGRATEIGYDVSDTTYDLEPHAIDYPVDKLEQLAQEDLEDVFKEAAVECADIGNLSHEVHVVSSALEAAGPGEPADWDSKTDPVAIIDRATLDVRKAAKMGSLIDIRIAMGAEMWLFLKNHPRIKGNFVVGNAKAANTTTPTPDAFGQLIMGSPEVQVSFMIFDDAAEGLPEDIKFVLDSSLLVFAAKKVPTRRDPSFMKTLRLMGKWMVPGSYDRDDGRVGVVKMDWFGKAFVSNPNACRRFYLPEAAE